MTFWICKNICVTESSSITPTNDEIILMERRERARDIEKKVLHFRPETLFFMWILECSMENLQQFLEVDTMNISCQKKISRECPSAFDEITTWNTRRFHTCVRLLRAWAAAAETEMMQQQHQRDPRNEYEKAKRYLQTCLIYSVWLNRRAPNRVINTFQPFYSPYNTHKLHS